MTLYFNEIRLSLVEIDNQLEYEYVNRRITKETRDILQNKVMDFRMVLNRLERD